MRKATDFNPNKVLFMLECALMLWIISILTSDMAIGDYGLIHGLNPIFFLATTILTISFLVALAKSCNHVVISAHILALIVFLYATPTLLEGTPRYLSAYAVRSGWENIAASGHLSVPKLALLFFDWPGFSLLMSGLLLTSGASSYFLMEIFPTVLGLIYIPTLYTILRPLTGDTRTTYVAIWIFYLIGWAGQLYALPQSLGSILFFFIIGIIMLRMFDGGVDARPFTIPLGMLLLALALSHGLSTSMLVATLTGIALVWLLVRLTWRINKVKMVSLAIVFGVLFVLLQYLPAFRLLIPLGTLGTYMDIYFMRLDPGQLLSQVIWSFTYSPEAGRTRVLLVRFLFLGVYALFFILGLISTMRSKERRLVRTVLFGWLIGVSSLLLFTSYSGEILMRVLIFALIPVFCMVVKNMSNRTLALFIVVLLVVSPVLSVVSIYGNEIVDYIHPTELNEADFFSKYTNRSMQATGPTFRAWVYKDIRTIDKIISIDEFAEKAGSYSGYVWTSRKDFEYFDHMYRKQSENIEEYVKSLIRPIATPGWHAIYSNGYSKLYVKNARVASDG